MFVSRLFAPLVAVVALAACDGPEKDTGEAPDDADADGFSAPADCDDADPDVHPAANETCDGVDQDCDGAVDDDADDATPWYGDADGDGWGDPGDRLDACDAPAGYVDDDTDCDDADPYAFPGAPEVCDGVDDDCDDVVDPDTSADAGAWYPDADGDGFGRADAQATVSCEAPPGYVAEASDCADTDAAVHPGADEVCDGLDDDCDGSTDPADSLDASIWYADVDEDGFGDAGAVTAACERPAGTVSDPSDCDDHDATVSPAGVEVCDGVDDDCDGVTDPDTSADAPLWYADVDGDGFGDAATAVPACLAPAGFVADGTDCDDALPGVSPAAVETCDGLDDDCDGAVDPATSADATTWHADDDGDGYGDPLDTTVACSAPAGTVADGADCDDGNAGVSPGATEVCDDVDDDCDGVVDPATSRDATRWYADVDGDGFGDAAVAETACDAPAAYVADATDCDDATASTFPGADEVCDGVDDDCDGVVDPTTSLDAPAWYTDADGDGYGDPATLAHACSAPAGTVADATDCDDADGAVSPAATEVCDAADVDEDCDGYADDADAGVTGRTDWYVDADDDGYGEEGATALARCEGPAGCAPTADDCDDADARRNPAGWPCTTELATSDAVFKLSGSGGDSAGDTVWGGDDYDLDGEADYVVGAANRSAGKGAAFVVFGPRSGTVSLSSADVTFAGTTSIYVGQWVGHAGDLDGDGNDDLGFVASRGGFYGYDAPVASTDTIASPDVLITGESASFILTGAAGGLDFDGDGQDDLAVSDGNHSSSQGSVYVELGPLSGTSSLATADLILRGEAAGDAAGSYNGFARGGDLDGDGLDELLVGATYADRAGTDAGAAYVVAGGTFGTVSLADADAIVTGTAASEYVAEAVQGGGDADGDGYGDVLIGSARNNGYRGAAWLMAGPLSGVTTTAAATASFPGRTAYDYIGGELGDLGDMDGDGVGDLLVGALLDYTCGAGTGTGSVYVFYGPVAGTLVCEQADVVIAGSTTNMRFSSGLASVGDVDGDGGGDVLVGANLDGGGTARLFSSADF